MHTLLKTTLALFFSVILVSGFAQTTTKKSTSTSSKSKTTTTAKKPATVYGKEVQVTLKNMAEGTVAIFAGPKEDLREVTKRKTVGGLSKNNLFLRVNEVVCIVKGEKTVSCASVKATTTLLEINSSATELIAK
ncbi:MAG: hypothetical protein KA149_12540 [Chitinophagales bacterium]|nr:hypothetical protein [Chitinophagales bacterium]